MAINVVSADFSIGPSDGGRDTGQVPDGYGGALPTCSPCQGTGVVSEGLSAPQTSKEWKCEKCGGTGVLK